MRRFAVAALALALALPVLADPVELKAGIKAGDKITRTTGFGGKGKITVTMGEQEQELTCKMGDSTIQAEEVLEAKDGVPTKMKRYYQKKYSLFQIPEVGQDQSKDSALLGKVVLLETKDGKVVATCEGADEDELKGEKMGVEMDAAMLPGKPVNVGDSWDGDGDKVKQAFGGNDDQISDAKLACKLEAVEEKFGEKCAKVAAKVTLKGTKEENGEKMKMTITLEGPVWFGLQSGRVLGMDMAGKLTMSGGMQGGQKLDMAVDVKAGAEGKTGVADFDAEPEAGGDEGDGEDEEGDEGK